MKVNFTRSQADHAREVLNFLVLEKRFFINIGDEFDPEFEYIFDEELFNRLLMIQEVLLVSYDKITEEAKKQIITIEKVLGFSSPELAKNQSIVQCNKYGGGFDLKSIFPLSYLLGNVISEESIKVNLLEYKRVGYTDDDLSPKQNRQNKKWLESLSEKILKQFEILKNKNNFEDLSVVLLKAKYNLNNNRGIDFEEGKLNGIKEYPELLGYLFYEYYKYSKENRFIPYSYIIFDTSPYGHLSLQNWSDDLHISYQKKADYDCSVHFATIL